MKPKVTLDKFYSEFVRFAQENRKEHQAMNKKLNKMDKKIDYVVDFLDREVLDDRKRIGKLEDTVYKQ